MLSDLLPNTQTSLISMTGGLLCARSLSLFSVNKGQLPGRKVWEEASPVIAGLERILIQRKSFRSLGLMWETNLPYPAPLPWKGSRGSRSCLGAVIYSYLGQLQVLLTPQVLLLPCGLVGSASSKLGDEKYWEGLGIIGRMPVREI